MRAVSPAFSIATVIALPPPWTTTGRMPTVCMKTTSTSRAPERLGIFHHRAAQLDDRELAVELADEAQRLDQYVRLADGFLMHRTAPPVPDLNRWL